MAIEEINFEVVMVNEWQHQSIMPIFSTVMMMPWTAAPHELLRESIIQILNVVPKQMPCDI